jgi:drug/metabolite transporter superfamily protein YnfA
VFERQTYYTRPLWLTGLVLVVLGAIGDFEALGFAPQALVAAVGGGFTVLANVFFAHLWLGQILTKTDVLGTLLIIIGVVLSTVANEPDEQMSLLELEKQFFQLGFLIYLGVMVRSCSFAAGVAGFRAKRTDVLCSLPLLADGCSWRHLWSDRSDPAAPKSDERVQVQIAALHVRYGVRHLWLLLGAAGQGRRGWSSRGSRPGF